MPNPGVTTEQALVRALGEALSPLQGALASETATMRLLSELGFIPPTAVTGLGLDAQHLQTLIDALTQLINKIADETAQADDYISVGVPALQLVDDIYRMGPHLATIFDEAYLAASHIEEELPGRLLDWLLVRYLVGHQPLLGGILAVLGLIDPAPTDGEASLSRLRLDRLGTLVSDPSGLATDVYGWGTTTPHLGLALNRMITTLQSFWSPAFLTLSVEAQRDIVTVDGLTARPPDLAVLPLVSQVLTGGELTAGVQAQVVTADGVLDSGLAIGPYVTGGATFEVMLDGSGRWSILISVSAGFAMDAITLHPGPAGRGVLVSPPASFSPAGTLSFALRRKGATTGERVSLLNLGEAGVIDCSAMTIDFFMSTGGPDPSGLDLGVQINIGALRFVLGPPTGDGFLFDLLPVDGITVALDLRLSWSVRHGFRLGDGGALEVDLPLHTDPGSPAAAGVHLTRASVALRPAADGSFQVALTADFVANLGSFVLAVSKIGVKGALRQSSSGGNLGPADLVLGFCPPAGLGLAIDASAVSGGGFLWFDPDVSRYAGVFELTIAGTVSVKAVALITTKMPDGSPGFALLIMITADGFTPIQLGMGFSLTGIGGLLALNHTVDADAVRGGLRNGVLDSILFVKDPIKNANTILSTLNRVFPLASDRLLIGPLAEISWGSPPLVKLRVALLLEVPQPIRVVLLAAISVLLPDPTDAVVELQVDAIGVLDLGRRELALDASLHDSRLLTFALTGDMAVRLNWGDDPMFVLSLGGFHPKFVPPKGLRPLNRLALSLANGANPRIRFEAYLALTSNTLQMGARVNVHAEEGGFGLDGGGSFDALIQWSPFTLDVSFGAWVRVYGPTGTLVAISVALDVTGPRPWHVTGKATVQLLFFSVSVGVDFTLGVAPAHPEPVETIDVAAGIWAQLSDPRRWEAVLPAGATPGATLAGLPPASATAPLVAHPFATIGVRQQIVPLTTPIERVGGRVPSAGTRSYTAALHVPSGVNAGTLNDLFAPGQYSNLPDDVKISSPSFEQMPAGVSMTALETAVSGPSLTWDATVQTLDVTSLDQPATPVGPVPSMVGAAASLQPFRPAQGRQLRRL